jgi:outer membrane protein assembly factor BamA
MDQTGDIKLEINAELRARLVGDLHAALFVDAGNVWLLRKDELRPGAEFSKASFDNVAVGTGLGLRYDLDFLVLRFDVGVALHAPYETGKSGWYNIPKFADGLAYNFAIGYPF